MEWKKIKGYKKYSVSDQGQVRNDKSGRILKQRLQRTGYVQVVLSKNGKTKTAYVHRLVALTFIPNQLSKAQVNHINGNKLNNNINNLEWNTASENTIHAYKNGLTFGPPKKPIRCIETGIEYESLKMASDKLKLHKSSISHVLNGLQKTTGGLRFEYI